MLTYFNHFASDNDDVESDEQDVSDSDDDCNGSDDVEEAICNKLIRLLRGLRFSFPSFIRLDNNLLFLLWVK